MHHSKYFFLNYELFFCRRDEIINGKTASSPGLFGGKKVNTIFSEVWRIPDSETDRSSSFAAHCSKSLILLLDVLKNIPDVNLVDISAQLRKPPSEENITRWVKLYIIT